MIQQAIDAMKTVFREAPYGVDHTLRVYQNARDILEEESLPQEQQAVVEMAAILHDIGALEALRKYGSMDGTYQEKEGEILARQILGEIGCPADRLERVCYLVGHHHSPDRIDGPDFQVLWDADLLDNLEYGTPKKSRQELAEVIQAQFQTVAGRRLALVRLAVE